MADRVGTAWAECVVSIGVSLIAGAFVLAEARAEAAVFPALDVATNAANPGSYLPVIILLSDPIAAPELPSLRRMTLGPRGEPR